MNILKAPAIVAEVKKRATRVPSSERLYQLRASHEVRHSAFGDE